MSRQEEHREDLYAEFRSALARWELQLSDQIEPITIGIRKDQRISIYFGNDPCYHFNTENELLRAFVDDQLYRTQGHTLARLTRHRTANQTQLQRHDLTDHELTEFLQQMLSRLGKLNQVVHEQHVQILRTTEREDPLHLLGQRLDDVVAAQGRLAAAYPSKRR